MKKIILLTFLLFCSGLLLNAQDINFDGDLGPTGTGTIPDGGGAAGEGIDAKCTVSGIGNIKDFMFVKVMIDITHTYDTDLEINLISPGGISLILASEVGETGDNFKNTRFTQTATLKIDNKDGGANPPFNGEFLPQEDEGLAKFNSINADGIWTLHIQDNTPIDNGNLNKWTLTFNKNPIIKPTVNFSHTDDFLNVNFKNESSDTTVNFIWDFGDGDTSISVSPSHTFKAAGTYTVKLFGQNAAGQDSSIQELIVSENPNPNGISNFKIDEIAVYPNPFNKSLNIKFKNKIEGNIELRNAIGQLILEKKIDKSLNDWMINSADLQNGIYTIYFKTENGISIIKAIK